MRRFEGEKPVSSVISDGRKPRKEHMKTAEDVQVSEPADAVARRAARR